MKVIVILIILFIPIFLLRYSSSQPHYSIGDKVRITTRLAQEPYLSNTQQVLNVSRIRVYLPRFPEYHYGDRIQFSGTITKGKHSLYLANASSMLLEKRNFLPELRNRMISIIEKTLPQPESALVSGISLGAKEGITPEFFSSLKNSGVLHVVVASGTNVTLLTRVLIGIFVFFFARRIAIPAALLGIWSYVFLIGLEAPIIRAAIMGSLAFVAQETGRIYFAWWSLFLTAAVMLLFEPLWITDIGFLLSFTATASIIGFYSPIEKFVLEKLRMILRLNFLRKDFATALSAQIGVTPILLFAFGQFAPWSPIVNGLLLWTVAPIMILGFIGGLMGLLIEPLGQALILLTYPLALYFSAIVGFF